MGVRRSTTSHSHPTAFRWSFTRLANPGMVNRVRAWFPSGPMPTDSLYRSSLVALNTRLCFAWSYSMLLR